MSFRADASKKTKTQGSTQRKPVWVKVWAVIASAACLNFATGEVDWGQVAVKFRNTAGHGAHKQVHEDHTTFCRRHFNNLFNNGTVEDAHRSGRPPDISQEDALQAAAILKGGYWVKVKVKGLPGKKKWHLLYYTTMGHALADSEALRAIQTKYGVTPDALLRRMHAVDPDLIRVTLTSHHEFSYEELQNRMAWSLAMLKQVRKNPSMLYLIVFCDESTFVLHGRGKQSVQVYCSSGAARPCDVCYMSEKAFDPIKVHFFLAVTAHAKYDDANGVVLYEECTGTTEIKRRTNTTEDGGENVGDQEYMVS